MGKYRKKVKGNIWVLDLADGRGIMYIFLRASLHASACVFSWYCVWF